MVKYDKVLRSILNGDADANIRFADLVRLLLRLGFSQRIRGDHSIFTRPGIVEIINLQPKGAMAKSYQVKQVRGIILQYRLEPPRVSWRLFGLSVRQQAGPSRRAAASSLPQLRPAGYIRSAPAVAGG